MGCHGNHTISHYRNEPFLRTIFFLHLNGPIEQIGMHKKLSWVFNVGPPATQRGTSLSNVVFFASNLKFSLIFMNMQIG